VVALFLRRSDDQPAGPDGEAAAPAGAVLAPRSGLSVLIVDDEAQVRELTRDSLELLGYRTLTADSGAAALESLSREQPDVVVMDYAMPGLSGAETAAEARRLRPDLPIIFASGYADTAAVEAAVGAAAVILRKPFNMDELARAVATAATGGPPG
jgi:CheY-like chemotaxis protein